MQIRLRFTTLVLAVAALTMLPATALAQGPSVDTYGGTGGEVAAEVGEGGTPPANGEEPFGNFSGGSLSGDGAAEPGTLAQDSATTDDSDNGGTLPFTGSDTLVLGLGGLLLVAVGAAIAKISTRLRQTDAAA